MAAVTGKRFATAFDAALSRRGLTLGALRDRLTAAGTPISLATLSYWRSGHREPEQAASLKALARIEDILGLLPGELEDLLPRRRRIPAGDGSIAVGEQRPTIERLFGELGLPPNADELLIDREVTIRVDVAADRCQQRISLLAARECMVDGTDRFAWFMLHGDDEGTVEDFTSYSGFTPGRVLNDDTNRLSVTEALLDRELNRGDVAMLDWAFDVSGTPADNFMVYQVLRRTAAVTMWVRFDPAVLPISCHRTTEVHGVETSEEVEVHPSTGHTWTSFGPGLIGFRWDWGTG